ncbi:MAG: flagellar hook-associated protein FlgK, partial [Arenibacterium sp.]
MSLNIALNSALSGLAAAARGSTVISENIANALTPGYARRELELVAQGDVAAGVQVAGIIRHVDPAITANRRAADADLSYQTTLSDYHNRLSLVVGQASEPVSLTSKLADFSEALISASSRPESGERLNNVMLTAKDLANHINDAGRAVQDLRSEADRKIGLQIEELNNALKDVHALNSRIASTGLSGGSTASLLDQRQRLIDSINEMVPVNVVQRDQGRVAFYSNDGAILVDSSAGEFSFSPSNTIVADMTIEGGTLSALQLNGRALRTSSSKSDVPGGSLSGLFEIRDALGTKAQADLDAVARDLMERFEASGLDTTLAAGAPGLFTDKGAAFDATNQVGLAGRLQLNAAVDPEQGGETWRLRDGLGAITPGPAGDARFLQALQSTLETPRSPATGGFGTGLLQASDVAAALESRIAQAANVAEQR